MLQSNQLLTYSVVFCFYYYYCCCCFLLSGFGETSGDYLRKREDLLKAQQLKHQVCVPVCVYGVAKHHFRILRVLSSRVSIIVGPLSPNNSNTCNSITCHATLIFSDSNLSHSLLSFPSIDPWHTTATHLGSAATAERRPRPLGVQPHADERDSATDSGG
jgi:hypothetical protein